MKAKTDCSKCRKAIYKEAETAYLQHEYKFFTNAAESMCVFTAVAAVAVMHQRGRTKDYIKRFFDELCTIYDYPEIFGKSLDMLELKEKFEKEYDLDFSEIKLHIETEKEFVYRMKKGE